MSNRIFIDIETVPEYKILKEAPEHVQNVFFKKYKNREIINVDDNIQKYYEETAALYPEFAKIVCISLAFNTKGEEYKFISLVGDDEKSILDQLVNILNHKTTLNAVLCGHNIIEFDIPFTCKRLLKHRIRIPSMMNPIGKKIWDIKHIDSIQIVKFGSYKGFVSLANLCYLLGIPTPKDEMDGSMVADVYYSGADDRFEKISRYCEKDVLTCIYVIDVVLEEYKINKVIITH